MSDFQFLDQIGKAEQEGTVVFADSGASTPKYRNWYRRKVFPAKKFTELDNDSLEQVLRMFSEYRAFVSTHVVHTTPVVLQEMARFEEILSGKFRFLADHERYFMQAHRDKHEYLYFEENMEKSLMFGEICFTYMQACKSIGRNVITHQDGKYAYLMNVVQEVMHQVDKKIVTNGNCIADVELVASALYTSLFDNNAAAIITVDNDIHRLVIGTYTLLCEDQKGDLFRDALMQKPVDVYLIQNGKSQIIKCAEILN